MRFTYSQGGVDARMSGKARGGLQLHSSVVFGNSACLLPMSFDEATYAAVFSPAATTVIALFSFDPCLPAAPITRTATRVTF